MIDMSVMTHMTVTLLVVFVPRRHDIFVLTAFLPISNMAWTSGKPSFIFSVGGFREVGPEKLAPIQSANCLRIGVLDDCTLLALTSETGSLEYKAATLPSCTVPVPSSVV